jgi:hypothetical protein
MPIGSTVMKGEAGIHSINGGSEIELKLPTLEKGEYPPLVKFMAACVLRADEELGWWEDQVRWYDAHMKSQRFSKTRMQLRVVGEDES